jgi:hypothetical protein
MHHLTAWPRGGAGVGTRRRGPSRRLKEVRSEDRSHDRPSQAPSVAQFALRIHLDALASNSVRRIGHDCWIPKGRAHAAAGECCRCLGRGLPVGTVPRRRWRPRSPTRASAPLVETQCAWWCATERESGTLGVPCQSLIRERGLFPPVSLPRGTIELPQGSPATGLHPYFGAWGAPAQRRLDGPAGVRAATESSPRPRSGQSGPGRSRW